MEGRQWNRGNSKNARGNSNSRQLSQPTDQPELDPMMSSLQKSHIASILQNARTSVGQEVSRPFTPGDLPRHLFSGNDYDNRPGSSYKMKNVVGQAIDEFTSAVGNQSFATSATSNAGSSSGKIQMIGSQKKDQNILNMMQKHDMSKRPRGNQLAPIIQESKKPLAVISKPLKTFDSSKPIKVLQSQSSDVQQQESQQQQPKVIKLKRAPKNEVPQDPVVQTVQTKQEQEQKDDFQDLMTKDEQTRIEEIQKFDQSKMDNLIKIQQIQQQIKQANRKREDDEDDDADQDEYADYFESEMLKDMAGVEQYQIDQYSEALHKVTEKTKDINQESQEESKDVDDALEAEYLGQNLEEPEGYEAEFQEVIQEMSRVIGVIKSTDKSSIREEDMLELGPRIWTLATEHEKQPKQIQEKYFLETLLKGSFCLLAIEYPRCVLRFSACNIHLFLKIFDAHYKNANVLQPSADFSKLFKNYLYETMKSLLLQAKEGTHDILFKEENLIPQLQRVIQVCFLERSDLIMSLTSQKVNDKFIYSDDLYDLINYTVGSIKCFTQSNVEVQADCIKYNYIKLISRCTAKALTFGNNQSKQSQILVQMCGTLRNLANDDNSYQQVCENSVISKLIEILEKFKGHKELMLNVSRILSKVSLDPDCSLQIINTNRLGFMVDLIREYQGFTSFLIRISFILANLTTFFDEAREQISEYKDSLQSILSVAVFYFQKDESGEQQEGKTKEKIASGNLGSVEDSLVKLIRLVANLCTEGQITKQLQQNKDLVQQYFDLMLSAIQRKNPQDNEEFLFNAISCATNLLFYDTPNSLLFTQELRVRIFGAFRYMILQTQNEEIQIESVRVLSNLSRHQYLCEEFVSDKTFLEAVIVVLDHTLRDLVFYAIGIIINITLHEEIRPKILDKNMIPKLVDVLKDANIEDMDLAKVAAKALHNVVSERNYWNIDIIKKLDEILSSLGEELDSIMDVASEDDLVEIKALRDMVNALVNDMPEPMFDCPEKTCGRKFKNKEELNKHRERRHGHKI